MLKLLTYQIKGCCSIEWNVSTETLIIKFFRPISNLLRFVSISGHVSCYVGTCHIYTHPLIWSVPEGMSHSDNASSLRHSILPTLMKVMESPTIYPHWWEWWNLPSHIGVDGLVHDSLVSENRQQVLFHLVASSLSIPTDSPLTFLKLTIIS